MFTNRRIFLNQGYFYISGIEKPLLHTWTLSVEEQFYFLVSTFWCLFSGSEITGSAHWQLRWALLCSPYPLLAQLPRFNDRTKCRVLPIALARLGVCSWGVHRCGLGVCSPALAPYNHRSLVGWAGRRLHRPGYWAVRSDDALSVIQCCTARRGGSAGHTMWDG